MNFPLFDLLQTESKELSAVPDVWRYVINMPLEHLETIYALIWHYYQEDNTKTSNNKKIIIPYKGKVFENGKGIIYHVKDIPIDLQKIIACYISKVVLI